MNGRIGLQRKTWMLNERQIRNLMKKDGVGMNGRIVLQRKMWILNERQIRNLMKKRWGWNEPQNRITKKNVHIKRTVDQNNNEKKMGLTRTVDQRKKKTKKKFLHPQFIADAIHNHVSPSSKQGQLFLVQIVFENAALTPSVLHWPWEALLDH